MHFTHSKLNYMIGGSGRRQEKALVIGFIILHGVHSEQKFRITAVS